MSLHLQDIQHFCAYQERCHSEVRYKLLELSFRGEQLEQAIASLISDDFLNEERFARSYCRGKFRMKQWGRQKIIQNLKQKQVSAYCIQKGLSEIDPEEYKKTIQSLAEKKKAELHKERFPHLRKQKVLRYLVQKGYEYDLVNEVLNRDF
jgi:regulatory protein